MVTNFDCVAFKDPTTTFEKLVCLGYCKLVFLNLHMYKTYYILRKPNIQDLE